MLAIRSLLVCVLVFCAAGLAAQYKSDWRSDIDLIIQRIDSLSLKSQQKFSLVKPWHPDKDIRENWYYTTVDGKVAIFEIQYVVDSIEHSEIYYIHKGRLICMEQYEVPYLSVYADQLKSGKAYFFRDNSLKQYVVTGKPKNIPGLLNSEMQTLAMFQRRYAELQRHIRYMR
ncbi:MAG TPA: hypothetical protein VD993_15015 [Chitinophagaceae bacterium]|nr:hypothetical protein [Chitinophagaceae bacterium]